MQKTHHNNSTSTKLSPFLVLSEHTFLFVRVVLSKHQVGRDAFSQMN